MVDIQCAGYSTTDGQLPRRHNVSESSETILAARVPWTSARCSRLLRPISSKIALLRKEVQHESRRKEQDLGLSGSCFRKNVYAETWHDNDCPTDSASATTTNVAGEWEESPRPRKKVKRTYSNKIRTLPLNSTERAVEARDHCQPRIATIELPSQLLPRSRPVENCAYIEGTGRSRSSTKRDGYLLPELPKSSVASNWKLIDGICKGLVALLKATPTRESVSRVVSRIGCRSLSSTCLGQIPKYIAEEEIIAKADDPDNDADIANVIYNDLEDFGSTAGGGWEPLRDLVRAHGIKMVTDAIEEGLLGLSVARHLYYLLLEFSEFDGVSSIVESLINLAKPASNPPSKSAEHRPHDLHMTVNCLETLSRNYGKEGFLYQHTAAMLKTGLIPIDWISSTPMIATWNGVIRSITSEDGNAQSAASLLQTAVAMSYRSEKPLPVQDVHELRLLLRMARHRPKLRSARSGPLTESVATTQRDRSISSNPSHQEGDSGIRSTLFNILTVVSAISYLQIATSTTALDEINKCATIKLQDLALQARQAIEVMSEGAVTRQDMLPRLELLRLPLLAAGIAELASTGFRGETSHCRYPSLSFLSGLPFGNGASSSEGSFLCAVARYCGRARSEDPFNVVKIMVQNLIIIFKSSYSNELIRKLCRDLALAAAFTYSEDTSRPQHLDWALQVELTLNVKGARTPKPAILTTPAPGNKRYKSEFRWEEGICEWIARTPDLTLRIPPCVDTDNDRVNIFTKAPTDDDEEGQIHSLLTPSASKGSKIAKSVISNGRGEAKALHVFIDCKANGSCSDVALKGPSRASISQHSRQKSQPKPLQHIHEDDDFDELSTPDPSQERAPVLSTLQQPPSAIFGAKSKKNLGWTEARKENDAVLCASDTTVRFR